MKYRANIRTAAGHLRSVRITAYTRQEARKQAKESVQQGERLVFFSDCRPKIKAEAEAPTVFVLIDYGQGETVDEMTIEQYGFFRAEMKARTGRVFFCRRISPSAYRAFLGDIFKKQYRAAVARKHNLPGDWYNSRWIVEQVRPTL